MGTMNNGTSWNDAITINKQSGTKITLDTDSKFVAKDIELTINVQAGSAATPNTTITANPTLSVNSSTGVVTANVNATESISPTVTAGYISTGSAGTMTVSGSNTLSLSTQAAQTITPTTTDQTITSGKYLIGTQTIKGDADLIPANIKNGVSIFNVTGTGMTDVLLEQNSDGVINIPDTTSDVNTLRLQSKNVTPSATQQNVIPDNNYDGLSQVTISGDSNLIAANIAEGVSIFGITGIHSGGTSLPSFEPNKVIEFSVYGEDRGETFVLYTINGMTWNEYINSNFKGHDLFIVYPDTNTIYSNALTYQGTDPVRYGNAGVSPNDVIQENGSYVIFDDETGGGSGR